MALAAAGLAPQANAAFTTGKCAGDDIAGNGASFAKDAQLFVFQPGFRDSYCGDTAFSGSQAPVVTYTADGSGAGRAAMMERIAGGSRFGGSDEPPSAIDIQKMNTGVGARGDPARDANPADNGVIHVVPAAVGAVAPLVNFPDACDVNELPAESKTPEQDLVNIGTPDDVIRVRFTKAQFEGIWAQDPGSQNWDDVFPDLTCSGVPIIRVVRFDESGTTYAFKDELAAIDPNEEWLTRYTFGTNQTKEWPGAVFGLRNDCPDPDGAGPLPKPNGPGSEVDTTDHLTSGCSNGNGSLVATLNNTDGSVGYSDISTARNASPPLTIEPERDDNDRYWTQLPDGTEPTPVFREPTSDPNGFRTDGNKGANCGATVFHNGTGGAPLPTTLESWSNVSGVNSPGAYGICTLTYGLVFDDNADVWGANTAGEESKARTVKDYWENIVSTPTQNALPAKDYAPLPADLLAIARAGVDAIDWNKGPGGGGGGGGGGNAGGGDNAGGGGGGGAAGVSNKFSLPRKSISSRTGGATISVKLPGPGKLEMVGTAKVQAGGHARVSRTKTIKVGRVVLNANRAGTFDLTLKPSGAAKKELLKRGSLKVSLKFTFTPTGGTPSTSTTSLTLKLKKKKGKRG
jgi:ABC-type phosphate transport system substrate-binding protein